MRALALLGRLELAVLIAAALFALAFHLRLPGRLPSEAEHRQVGEVLAAEAAPGDAVLLYPWWTERARLYAPPQVQVVGYLGSDGDDLVHHPRVWLLAQPDLPRSDLASFEAHFLAGRRALGPTRRFGRLALTLYQNERYREALFSATDALARARVYLEGPDGRADCAWNGRQHQCPNGKRVAAEWHELFYQPRRCIYAPPPGGPARLVLEFADAPPGARWVLEAGIAGEYAAQKDDRVTPVQVAVETAAGTAMQLSIPPGLEGPQRAEAAAMAGPLRVAVQANSPERREVCVELYGYRERL